MTLTDPQAKSKLIWTQKYAPLNLSPTFISTMFTYQASTIKRQVHFKLKFLGNWPAADNLISLDAVYIEIYTAHVHIGMYIDTS